MSGAKIGEADLRYDRKEIETIAAHIAGFSLAGIVHIASRSQ